MIAIVNYGSGNVKAIVNIYERLNIRAVLADTAEKILNASKIVLPGVGAFDDTLALLNNSGMRQALELQVIDNKVPVMGVCVGMQIMACKSEEGRKIGLGWFEDSEVVKFDELTLPHKPKLPHMGWNTISSTKIEPMFDGIDPEKGFYFLHSYKFVCKPEHKLAVTSYGGEFVSAVRKNNIFGFQFHPEKSHLNGINLFKNFADINKC